MVSGFLTSPCDSRDLLRRRQLVRMAPNVMGFWVPIENPPQVLRGLLFPEPGCECRSVNILSISFNYVRLERRAQPRDVLSSPY